VGWHRKGMIETATAYDEASAWFFDQVRAIALDATERGGSLALVERSARRGHMPPLHRRDEDETYRVVSGRVTFFVDGYAVVASAGDVVVAPAGVPRTFRADSDDARWLALTRVRARERFEDFGRAVGEPVPEPLADGWFASEEAATVASIARCNGIEILGPPGALPS
jgi:mannose-6-phosphate isomerase-like protein (cupin superfamily)